MPAKYILAIVCAVFLVLALVRFAKNRGRVQPASKTWFLIGGIFVAISIWLWMQKSPEAGDYRLVDSGGTEASRLAIL